MYKVKVLIVEDDFLVAEDISESLEEHNLEVIGICSSGEEAIVKAEADRPDLVLMDIKLEGEIDGIEAGKVIKEKLGVPIIFLSDYTDPETVERSKKALPVNYLGKPFNENDLVRAIDLAFHNFIEEKKSSGRCGQLTYVFLKEGYRYVKIRYESIIFLKADRAYCTLITEDQKFSFSKSLYKIEEQLHYDQLFRTHRSYLVNMDKITEVIGNIIKLGEHTAELSPEKREVFFEKLSLVR